MLGDEQTVLSLNSPAPPVDKYNTVFFIFVILGAGGLFPFNAFITSYDYWELLYPKRDTVFWISAVYNTLSIPVILFLIWGGHLIPMHIRTAGMYGVCLIVLVVVPIIGEVGADDDFNFILTLIFALIAGTANALLTGTLLSFSSIFPPAYTSAIMGGMGVAGLIVGTLKIIIKVAIPNTDAGIRAGSIIYFASAGFVMLLCIIFYFLLQRVPFSKYYVELNAQSKRVGGGNAENHIDSKTPLLTHPANVEKKVSVAHVLWKVSGQAASCCLNFWITLALFPGVTSLVNSSEVFALNESGWFQIIMMSIFMLFDFIGRFGPRFTMFIKPRAVPFATLLRLVFFVLFIFCIKPKLFYNDAIPYIIMATFAITNGYMGTIAMVYGPLLTEDHEKEKAGIIMSMSLNTGIVTGSWSGVGLKSIFI